MSELRWEFLAGSREHRGMMGTRHVASVLEVDGDFYLPVVHLPDLGYDFGICRRIIIEDVAAREGFAKKTCERAVAVWIEQAGLGVKAGRTDGSFGLELAKIAEGLQAENERPKTEQPSEDLRTVLTALGKTARHNATLFDELKAAKARVQELETELAAFKEAHFVAIDPSLLDEVDELTAGAPVGIVQEGAAPESPYREVPDDEDATNTIAGLEFERESYKEEVAEWERRWEEGVEVTVRYWHTYGRHESPYTSVGNLPGNPLNLTPGESAQMRIVRGKEKAP